MGNAVAMLPAAGCGKKGKTCRVWAEDKLRQILSEDKLSGVWAAGYDQQWPEQDMGGKR